MVPNNSPIMVENSSGKNLPRKCDVLVEICPLGPSYWSLSDIARWGKSLAVQKEGNNDVTGVRCVHSPNWMAAVVVLPVPGLL